MKLISNSILRQVSIKTAAFLFMASIHHVALADDTAELKDTIKMDSKVAELKSTDANEIEAAGEQFKYLDANRDGKISLKEAVKNKALANQFDDTDVNHDGMISTDEYISFQASLPASPVAITNQ